MHEFLNHLDAPGRSHKTVKALVNALIILVLLPVNSSAQDFNDDARKCLETKQDPEWAIEYCTRAIRSDQVPKDQLAEAFYNRGEAYISKKEYVRAVHDFDAAIELKPNFTRALYSRGTLFHLNLEYDRAMQDFNEVIRLDPSNALAYQYRSVLHGIKDDSQRAVQDFNEARRLNPTLMSVKWELCGRSEICDLLLNESKRLSFKSYQIYFYVVGGTGYGTAAGVFRNQGKNPALVKVFKAGSNGEILAVNPKILDGKDYLEVYEATSKGNGTIELFRLEGSEVSLVFEARAVDYHDDGSMFDGGILRALYPDINRDGHFDIILEGTVVSYSKSAKEGVLKRRCKRVFLWSDKSKKFQETRSGEINPQLCAD